MVADTFHFVWWNVHSDTCDGPSETKKKHTHTQAHLCAKVHSQMVHEVY